MDSPPDRDFDEERVRVRETLLDLVNPLLANVVDECAKRTPMREIAAFVEGDKGGARRVLAGGRRPIAEELRALDPKGALDYLADMLMRAPYDGLLPCVCVVRLSGGSVDVSVVALRMDAVH